MRELLEKYVEMRALRLLDAEGSLPDPRPRMRALAARFPGALREIDELPLEVIEARIEALEAGLRRERAEPSWARPLADYHAWLRAALAIRRHAGKDRDRARALAWIDALPSDHAPSPEALRSVLDVVLRPPEGRLNRWVFAHLAALHGRGAPELEAELFPGGPGRGARPIAGGAADA